MHFNSVDGPKNSLLRSLFEPNSQHGQEMEVLVREYFSVSQKMRVATASQEITYKGSTRKVRLLIFNNQRTVYYKEHEQQFPLSIF